MTDGRLIIALKEAPLPIDLGRDWVVQWTWVYPTNIIHFRGIHLHYTRLALLFSIQPQASIGSTAL